MINESNDERTIIGQLYIDGKPYGDLATITLTTEKPTDITPIDGRDEVAGRISLNWSMPLLEAAMNPAQHQHEATKRAIVESMHHRIQDAFAFGLTNTSRQLEELQDWINELKLEDTK